MVTRWPSDCGRFPCLVTLPAIPATPFDTDEDRFLFFGDIVHVPALQFGNPAFSWGYDDDQPTARATRQKVFHDAAEAGTWIAGAHLGRPGVGRVVRKAGAYAYEPAA